MRAPPLDSGVEQGAAAAADEDGDHRYRVKHEPIVFSFLHPPYFARHRKVRSPRRIPPSNSVGGGCVMLGCGPRVRTAAAPVEHPSGPRGETSCGSGLTTSSLKSRFYIEHWLAAGCG